MYKNELFLVSFVDLEIGLICTAAYVRANLISDRLFFK